MALIACPECRGQVSSSTAKCPHCGFVINKPRRGVIGQLIKWSFVLWNILMIVWLVAGVSSASSVEVHSKAEEAGRAAGTAIGVGLIMGVWMVGSVILGILVLLTRPRS